VKSIFIPYISDIFKDLSERAKGQNDQSTDYINKYTFLSFLNLPVILSERLFNICTRGQVNVPQKQRQVSLQEFRKLMQRIFYSRVETKMSLVFEIYDFDYDGLISIEDIKIILSHIPSKIQSIGFNDKINSLNLIKQFLDDLVVYMNGQTSVDIKDFRRIN
jgi:Ca2+-binding EF-hand superfamily protein